MIEPTKKRLTIIFTAVVVLFNVVILALSYLILQRSIMSGVKTHMEEDIRTEFLYQYNQAGLDPFRRMWDEHHFQILNRQGSIVVSTQNSVNFYPELNWGLLASAYEGKQEFETRNVKDEPYLISYFPLDGKYVGRVSVSLVSRTEYEEIFLRMVVLSFPGMMVLSYMISRFLVYRAMKPISDIFTFQETFSSNVSHELRSPLASIKGNFEVALRRERSPQEYRDVILFALREVDRITSLLKNLSMLASSKFKPLDLFRNSTDINGVLNEVVESYAVILHNRRIRLDIHAAPGVSCLCDEALIRRTIENIFDNAAKYTLDGGSIKVVLGRKMGKVMLTVANSCLPIDRAEAARVAQPFYRGRATMGMNAEGKGLGLYIAAYIVRSHGGKMKVKVEPGGSVFRVVVALPAS